MFSNISYKMDINDIKEEIHKNYMQIAYNYVMSGEYFKKRKIRIFKIFIYSTLYFFINFLLWRRALPYVDETAGNFGAFAFVMSIMAPVFVGCVIYCQNVFFGRDIKKLCVKEILQDLVNIKYLNYKESQNVSNIITDNDIMDFNLTEKFTTKSVDDIFVGDYNGINYNLQEIKLYTGHGKGRTIQYEGVILKTKLNTNISGWIEVCTKECIEKPETLMGYFIANFFVLILFITIFSSSFNIINNFPLIFIGLIILASVISYIIAKHSIAKVLIKANVTKQQHRGSDNEYINEKIKIKASDNIENINNIITTEFVDVIEKLKKLFNTPKICCKFYSDKIMFAINSHKNMFEIGGLFTPPTNRKVAEKFISQISGIMLYLDYLDSFFDKSN